MRPSTTNTWKISTTRSRSLWPSQACLALALLLCISSYCPTPRGMVFAEASADKRDLYTPQDAVLRLTTETFQPTVFHDNKNVTFVVQFYNTYCGHCQMFSPIYKELASRVRNWTSVVRVAGIDCSKDENVAVCSDSKIEGYPTLFIYPPNSQYNHPEDAPLNVRSLNIEWNVDDLEETIITYIGNLTTSSRQHPLVVEAMRPIKEDDISALKRIYPTTQVDIVNEAAHSPQERMFLVEGDKSFLGRKLIIEYFRLHSRLELRRVLLTNKALLKSMLPKEEYLKLENSQPLLVKLDGHDTSSRAQILVRGEASHILPTLEEAERQDFIYNRFRTFFESYYQEELKEAGGGISNGAENTLTTRKPMTIDVSAGAANKQANNELDIQYLVHDDPVTSKKIFAVDLLKGVSYLITHEVRIKGNLSPGEFNTLRNLLTIFKKFLPLDKWDTSMSKFIDDLRTRLDENRAQYERDGITGQQLKDHLDFAGAEAIKARYSRESWVSCSDSDRQNKGYTCSLWLLFHTLTVGEYTKSAPVRSRPTLVLVTMREYITRFLGCTVCSSNFAKEAENLESSLIHRNSSVMWLWNTHNHVNQRLNNEREQRLRKPLAEVIVPRYARCPECFKTSPRDIGVDGRTLADIEWNLPNVLSYMTDTFKLDNIVTPVEMASLLASLKGKVNYDLLHSDLNNAAAAEHRRRGLAGGTDMNRSVEQWNLQSLFSASDMSICLFLYLCCIVIVALVCYSLNPKLRRTSSKSK